MFQSKKKASYRFILKRNHKTGSLIRQKIRNVPYCYHSSPIIAKSKVFAVMSANPYYDEETKKPILRKSAIGFLDILGFEDLVLGSAKDHCEQEQLNTLHQLLSETIDELTGSRSIELGGGKNLFETKTFSDNIVIGYPIRDDGEAELGSLLIELSLYQLTLANCGLFVRGSVHIGDIFIDDKVVFGSGLIEAYYCEKNDARDPRIILSKPAVRAVTDFISAYADVAESPYNTHLCDDEDGQKFLNYLYYALPDETVKNPKYFDLKRHKTSVENKIETFKGQPKIWNKYSWCAHYHNFFCEQVDLQRLRINMGRYQMKPSLLSKRHL